MPEDPLTVVRWEFVLDQLCPGLPQILPQTGEDLWHSFAQTLLLTKAETAGQCMLVQHLPLLVQRLSTATPEHRCPDRVLWVDLYRDMHVFLSFC